MIHDDVLGTIGRTPLVRLRRAAADLACDVVALLEGHNPGGSITDRTARAALDAALGSDGGAAERVVVRAGGGDGCVALALAAAARGVRCVVVLTDGDSPHEAALARALGADVRTCPAGVPSDDPAAPSAVAGRIVAETPGAVRIAATREGAAVEAAGAQLARELWESTDGRLRVLVATADGEGLLAAAGRALKEIDAAVRVVGIAPPTTTGAPPWHGGAGIDEIVAVGDKDAHLAASRLARSEGILTGRGGGAAVVGGLRAGRDVPAGELVVVVLSERGERALSTAHDEDWMRRQQYLAADSEMTAGELLARKAGGPRELVTLSTDAQVEDAIRIMRDLEVSQIPIVREGLLAGTLREDQIIDLLLHAPDRKTAPVEEIMEDPLPEVGPDARVEELQAHFLSGRAAVLVRLHGGGHDILTKYDLIHGLAAEVRQ